MQIYLPIAEMAVQAETPPAVAVGTQASQLVASSSTAVVGHWKKRNIDIKMAGVLLAGGFIGTILGIYIFKLLQYFGQVDIAISVLYVLFLCSIGGMMIRSRRKNLTDEDHVSSTPEKQSRYQALKEKLPYKMNFPDSRLYVSALVPLFIGFVGGLMVSVMGIGAGFLIVPAMIYMLRMPPLLVGQY